MNINIIKKILKKPPNPENKKERYIFVNDNRQICEAIIAVGYYAMYISRTENENAGEEEEFEKEKILEISGFLCYTV